MQSGDTYKIQSRIGIGSLLCLLMTVLFSCFEPYQPPSTTNNASYLVVDAFVNSTQGSASVILSHTVSLTSTDTLTQLSDAEVKLQDDAGNNFPMAFEGNGTYSVSDLRISASKKYQLSISRLGKIYQSDFVPVQSSPAIDTVTWLLEGGNLNVNVNTHDPLNVNNFYHWRFTETWEYRAPYQSAFKIRNDSVVTRPLSENVTRCWRTSANQKILIYNTSYLANNIVSDFTIQSVPSNSLKLTTNYSILVQQQTLTKAGYQYWLNIKKTTESLGSIFDPLPGAVVGNIKCVTVPSESVIGFFSVGEVTEKRIFIKRAEIISFVNYQYPFCYVNTVPPDQVKNIPTSDLVLSGAYSSAGAFLGWQITSTLCSDCRELGGGNTTKPLFWKD